MSATLDISQELCATARVENVRPLRRMAARLAAQAGAKAAVVDDVGEEVEKALLSIVEGCDGSRRSFEVAIRIAGEALEIVVGDDSDDDTDTRLAFPLY